MDHPSSNNDSPNYEYNDPGSLNMESDVLGSQFEVPATNLPIPSTNQLSSQME
jgi:hypothetical protein